jgi:regulator of protease activity HflC (stomatin/prohibitin superfamily)
MKLDLRRKTFPVSGQEVLTSDGVAVKISLAVRLRVVEPLKAIHENQDWLGQVYTSVQLALRKQVSEQTVEALMANRLDIGQQVLAQVTEQAITLGIEVLKTEVRDVMFPGDVKKVFTEVLRARQEGQAALERARGESAALRNLANAARLLENNPALQNLRLMQTMSGTGNTLVMGVPVGFVPLKGGNTKSSGSAAEGNTQG